MVCARVQVTLLGLLLVPVPFAQRVWALLFLTVLMPSERYYQGRCRVVQLQQAKGQPGRSQD